MNATEPGAKIGVGRTAEIFQYGPGRVLKLYREGWTEAQARAEYEKTLSVSRTGLPVPKVFEMGVYGGKPGIVFEFVEGQPLTGLLLRKPWKINWGARLFAELHAGIHSERSDLLPSLKENVERWITESHNLDQNLKERAHDTLQTVADENTICHGDFHPDNVLVGSEGVCIIDWMGSTVGSSTYDFARTAILLRIGIPEETNLARRIMIRSFQSWFASLYEAQYRARMDIDREDLFKWTLIAAAVRLAEGVEGERSALTKILEQVSERAGSR